MKMYNFKITSYSIRLFSALLTPIVFFLVPITHAEELSLYQKGYAQLPYVVDVSAVDASLMSRNTKTTDANASMMSLNWLLNNSIVEDGVYSLHLTQSKQNRNGGKPGRVWGNLDLKFTFELLPESYFHATFPGMSDQHFTKDALMTRFRVNRSRVMFTVGTHWD